MDTIYDCSRRLRTIAPFEKAENHDELVRAAQLITSAKYVYILGYGFDEANSNLLQLQTGLRSGKKVIMFTNLGDSNRINKKVSRLLSGTEGNFLNQTMLHYQGLHAEKSTRDVYEALELDFDSLHD